MADKSFSLTVSRERLGLGARLLIAALAVATLLVCGAKSVQRGTDVEAERPPVPAPVPVPCGKPRFEPWEGK